MPSRPDLAALLVAYKVASAREVAVAARDRRDGPLWRALVDGKVASARQIFETLRDHAKFPIATDKILSASPPTVAQLTRLVSKEDALRRGVLPFELSEDGHRAQIAMIDPTDEQVLRELARGGALQSAKVFVAERGALLAAIERLYAGRVRKETAGRNVVEPAAKVGQRSELEGAERLERILFQACIALGSALEVELTRGAPPGRSGMASDAARLAREVARALGYDRRRVAVAGAAALFVQLDALHRVRGNDARSPFEALGREVGWAGGGEDGILEIARALAAPAVGFGRQQAGGPVQRVVQAVADFLALGGPEGEPIELDAAEQLLRASSAGAPIVDALMLVLRRDLQERTPAAATVLPEAQDTQDAQEATDLTTVRPARTSHSGRQRIAPEDRTQQVSINDVTSDDSSPD